MMKSVLSRIVFYDAEEEIATLFHYLDQLRFVSESIGALFTILVLE